MISTKANPYFDDFDASKGYYQMLFKPGNAIQARELTQLQTILRDQIAKFGNHIFQHGSVVIPGNSLAELNVPYVTLSETDLQMSLFEGARIVGATSGVQAIVKKAVGPASATFYLSYVSGGGANGKLTFDIGEQVFVSGANTITATVATKGTGSLASVNSGVYYINGTFAQVNKQTVVLSAYDSTPSAHVLLKITESIVDYNTDDSLLDPAQNSANASAPGADRLKIELTLVTLPLGTAFGDDYVELMRYKDGELQLHSRFPKYSELEKSLARRTYDESGDYVVSGYDTLVKEHNKTRNNGGVFENGDTSKLVYDISQGRAYISGFEVETLGTTRVIADKARTADHIKNDLVTIKPSYGQYLLVAGATGFFDIENRQSVTLYDRSAAGSAIGTANIISLDYHTGDPVTSPIYRAYLYNINLTSGTIDSVGRIQGASGTAFVVAEYSAPLTQGSFSVGDVITNTGTTLRNATVAYYNTSNSKLYAYRHSANAAPIAGDQITGVGSPVATAIIGAKSMLVSVGQASSVFRLPKSATSSLKNASNLYDMSEVVYKRLTISTGATTSNSIASGTILPLEVGNFIAVSSTGPVDWSLFSLNGTGTAVVKSAAAVSDIYLYVQVKREAASPRTKTKTQTTEIGLTSATTVNLANIDVIRVISVISSGVDVTQRYTLDNGQTDYSYQVGKLRLKNGYTLPSGALTVTYEYFSHSAGDFFSVDSYTSLGSNYLDLIPSYVSPVTGETYQLRDCIDYRTSTSTGNAVVVDSILTTSVKRFLPRMDSICVNKSGEVVVITGEPTEAASVNNIPTGYHELQRVFVPAYTNSLTDIRSIRVATDRSTMKDIRDISDRVSRLEEYTTLSALEGYSVQEEIIDAKTGLSRYKTGYLTEDMSNPIVNADMFNAAFSATYDEFGIGAQAEYREAALDLVEGTFTTVNGVKQYTNGYALHPSGYITLAYNEVIFCNQPLSSKVTNINPFSVIAWTGTMKLSPNGDTWFEQVDLPTIFKTRTDTIVLNWWQAAPPIPTSPAGTNAFAVTQSQQAIIDSSWTFFADRLPL